MLPRRSASLQAFTIAEMAIVLTIVALIIGGVIGGQALVQSAAVNGVIRDMQKIKGGVAAFYDRYNGFPGDITNATKYWGAASGGCPSGAGTGTQTCDGDGNGQIGAGETTSEIYRAWQHMANAGLWGGTFSGTQSIATGQTVAGDNPGVNLPMGRYQGGTYGQVTYKLFYMSGYLFDSTIAGNYLKMAGSGNGLNACCGAPYSDGGAISSIDAYKIDMKIDDGLPAFGTLQTSAGWWASCTTTNVAATATYKITETAAAGTCPLLYDLGIK